MTTPHLYERTAELVALDQLFAASEGEVTPEQEAAAEAALGNFAAKVEACVRKRAELLAWADACTEESDRLARRAKALQSRAEWLSRYLLRNLKEAGRPEAQCPTFSVRVTPNPPKVAAVLLETPAMRSDVEALAEPLRAAVRVVPATPESYEWNRAELLKLYKAAPDALQGVAIITQDERITVA